MFGLDMHMLAFIGLAVLATCAIAYTILYDSFSNERKQGQRVTSIKNNTADKEGKLKAQNRLAEASKRRQSVQSSLKQLEESNKARDPNKASLKEQIKQAGLSWSMKKTKPLG